jgi:chromosome segregation ATPase
MPERRPPESISAAPEDKTGYRRGGGKASRRAPSGAAPSRSFGGNLLLVVLIAGLATAGWFIANQQRIQVLEDRLRVTDEALTDTGQDTKEQIGVWESEIRKLWAVSNERNKKWIEDNQAAIAKLTKSVEGLTASNRDMASAVGRHESAFREQQAIIDQITSIQLQLEQMVSTQRQLVERVNAASQSLSGLQSGLASRVTDNEQAVASMDAYRVQTNNRLAEIERRLAGLMGNPAL